MALADKKSILYKNNVNTNYKNSKISLLSPYSFSSTGISGTLSSFTSTVNSPYAPPPASPAANTYFDTDSQGDSYYESGYIQ